MSQVAVKHIPAPALRVEDLPSLASLAAVELDDLIVGRKTLHVEALPRLAEALQSWVRPEGEGAVGLRLDPTRMVVMKRAFDDADPFGGRPVTVEDLIRTTASLTRLLERPAEERSEDMLKRLRSFCLSLSRRAATSLYADDDDGHPFRR